MDIQSEIKKIISENNHTSIREIINKSMELGITREQAEKELRDYWKMIENEREKLY